ncbi:MAG: GreA/GreB family elongation factor [Verrucomicrobiales bacterium]|nr:GreA/GreB family elongation factor [Verrucomicrobiales bacterium]
MDKPRIIQAIIAKLTEDVELYFRAARAAQFEATDEQSKAENKYDTRGLEASYLARGQSRQAAETEQALKDYRTLTAKPFEKTAAIDLGALVELKGRRERMLFLMGPSAGGTEVIVDGEEITVITPQSPLGQQLMGRKTGDKVALPSGEERRVGSVE